MIDMGDSVNFGSVVAKHYGGLGQPMIGAEVGVHAGNLSKHLLNTFPNLQLYMIDIWHTLDKEPHYVACNDPFTQFTDADQEAWLREAIEATNFAELRRVILKMPSITAASVCIGPFDWVFLDACHHYDCTQRDMAAWWPLVRPGGLLAGHDYGHPLNKSGLNPDYPWLRSEIAYYGVNRAVDEFAEQLNVVPKLTGTCWSIVKP